MSNREKRPVRPMIWKNVPELSPHGNRCLRALLLTPLALTFKLNLSDKHSPQIQRFIESLTKGDPPTSSKTKKH